MSPKVISGCLAGVIASLLLVGLVSATPVRHTIQVIPAAIALAAVARRATWATYAALPVFIFWLAVTLAIWLWLLGIARIVTGRFTPAEANPARRKRDHGPGGVRVFRRVAGRCDVDQFAVTVRADVRSASPALPLTRRHHSTLCARSRSMRTVAVAALSLLLAAGGRHSARAQDPSSDLQAELLAQFDDAARKLLQLAEAIPQDKYTWRPGAGVRSVSEVVMHVAGGNYFLPTFAGVKSPSELRRDAETSVTEKGQVIDHLKGSIEHVRVSLRAFPEADLDRPATMFGRETTCRNVFLTTVTHAHEHLGQLIAYARVNGIVPPWSAGQGP